MIDSDWTFNGRLVEVIDGDTIDVEVDLGFKIQKRVRVRLVNTDTNEVYGVSKDSTEYKLGKEQSEFVKQYFRELRDGEKILSLMLTTHSLSQFRMNQASMDDGLVISK